MQDHTADKGYNKEDGPKDRYFHAYKEVSIENKYLKELLESRNEIILLLKHQVAILATSKIVPE